MVELDEVPGRAENASLAWNAFLSAFPRSSDGATFEQEAFQKMFHESRAATPDYVERVCKTLTDAGLKLREPAEAPPLALVPA